MSDKNSRCDNLFESSGKYLWVLLCKKFISCIYFVGAFMFRKKPYSLCSANETMRGIIMRDIPGFIVESVMKDIFFYSYCSYIFISQKAYFLQSMNKMLLEIIFHRIVLLFLLHFVFTRIIGFMKNFDFLFSTLLCVLEDLEQDFTVFKKCSSINMSIYMYV